MPQSVELEPDVCARLLGSGVVGRVAVSTPDGPHIVPVNYSVFEDTIVVRTTAHGLLATHGRDAMLAFEVDHIDHERHVGWSVVARGRAWVELDAEEVRRIRRGWPPRPWASGERSVVLRIRWSSLTGRSLGQDWTPENLTPVRRVVSAL